MRRLPGAESVLERFSRFRRSPEGLLTGASAISQGLTVIGVPLVAVLVGPAEVGSYLVYVAVVGFIGLAGSLRLELAIPIADADEVPALGRATLAISLIISLVGAAAILALVRAGIDIGLPRSSAVGMGIVAIGGLVENGRQLGRNYHLRLQSYRPIATNQVLTAASRLVLQVALVFLVGPTGWSLVLGEVASRGVFTVLLAWPLMRLPMTPSVSAVATLRKYRRYVTLSGPATFANAASVNLPLPLIGAALGPEAAGYIGLALRVMSAPTALIARALGDVYHGRAAARLRDGGSVLSVLRGALRRASLIAFGVALVLVVVLLAAGPFLPAEWQPVAPVAAALVPGAGMQFVSTSIDSTIIILQRQGLHLRREVLRLILTAVVLTITLSLTDGEIVTSAAISGSMVLSYAYYLHVARRAAMRAEPESGETVRK